MAGGISEIESHHSRPWLNRRIEMGGSCYTFQKKNVILMHGFKEYCAVLFHKGSLLKDPNGVLIHQTENCRLSEPCCTNFPTRNLSTSTEKAVQGEFRNQRLNYQPSLLGNTLAMTSRIPHLISRDGPHARISRRIMWIDQ